MPILYAPDGMPFEVPHTEISSFLRQGFRTNNPATNTLSRANNPGGDLQDVLSHAPPIELIESNSEQLDIDRDDLTSKININTCSLKELTSSLKLNTSTSRRVIDNRPFQSVEDLIAKVPTDRDWLAISTEITY